MSSQAKNDIRRRHGFRLHRVILCLCLIIAGPFSACSPTTEPPPRFTDPDDPCLAAIEPQEQTTYQTALQSAPTRVGEACTTTGICDAGDELGVLIFIRSGEGETIETRYYSGESEEFVGLSRLSETVDEQCTGIEYGPIKIECGDEQVVFDACELEELQNQQLLEDQVSAGAVDDCVQRAEQCGDTLYDPHNECCDHTTGIVDDLGNNDVFSSCPSTRVPVGSPCYKRADGCSVGAQRFSCLFSSTTATWGCPESLSQCAAAAAATKAGDLNALTSLPCNWHDLCYQICGKTKQECDAGVKTLMLAACDDLAFHCHLDCKAWAIVVHASLSVGIGDEPYRAGQKRNCACCQDKFFEDSGVLQYFRDGCFQIVTPDGRVFEPDGGGLPIGIEDPPHYVDFEWYPTMATGASCQSTNVILLNAIVDLGLAPFEFSGSGTLGFSEVEGGCFYIVGHDGTTYRPIGLPQELEDEARDDDIIVVFAGIVDPQSVGFCSGTVIEIQMIEHACRIDDVDPTETGVNINSEAQCDCLGGVWQVWGNEPPSCNLRARDAGDLCRDGAQCEGVCTDCADPDCTVGTCSEFRRFFACARYWNNGVIDDFAICP